MKCSKSIISMVLRCMNLKIRMLVVAWFVVVLMPSCVENNPALNTFTGDLVYSFLKKDTIFSEYVEIVDRAGLAGMLSAYGSYTCMAPTNEAFRKYYKSLGVASNVDSLSIEQIQYLARTHIVANKYMTYDLADGVLPNVNMNQRYIQINFRADTINNKLKIFLNDSSLIISRDNKVHNGVVHAINQVLRPLNYQLPELLMQNPDISIFTEALKLTGLNDSLRLVKDESYVPDKVFLDEYDSYVILTPKERKFGYSVFVESNELLRNNGVANIDDLIRKAAELYPDEGFENDFTHRKNTLNKYISYHLINRAIYLNKFFYTSHAIKSYVPDEFIETMLENRLIRVTSYQQRITFNHQSQNSVRIIESGGGVTVNGVYHLLDNILVYSSDVERMMQNIRIRFDVNSLFPELVNNNIRGSQKLTNFADGDRFGFKQGYLDGLKMSKDTRLIYLAGEDLNSWTSFQGDELMGLGSYDITIRLLPIPPGVYELRYGYSANPLRSVTQIYLDGKPIGIPLDLRISANDPKVGWVADNQSTDNGFENDKMMRNRGYMKGPTTFCVYFGPQPTAARHVEGSLRRIIGTFSFTEYAPHFFRMKSVMENPKSQLDIDFLEFVPKGVFSPVDGSPESRD